MGISVYYTCRRNHNLTDSEEQEIKAITDKYNAGFEE